MSRSVILYHFTLCYILRAGRLKRLETAQHSRGFVYFGGPGKSVSAILGCLKDYLDGNFAAMCFV